MIDMVSKLDTQIRSQGGYVNAHAHLDRAYSITEDQLCGAAYKELQDKWSFVDTLKRTSSEEDYYNRITAALIKQKLFGVSALLSFIDCDECSEMRALEAAKKARAFAKDIGIEFRLACQVLKGVVDPVARQWFTKALDYVEVIGGLPAKDAGYEAEHLDILLQTGRDTGKRVHVHVDQLDSKDEKETELLARKTIQWGMEGRVTAIHSISIGAHPKTYRQDLYRMCKDAGLSFICCPTAWIDRRRREDLLPVHNSITPIEEMIPAGLTVAIGSDNIMDVYKPFCDGNILTELRVMLEASHFYDTEELVRVATSNGRDLISP